MKKFRLIKELPFVDSPVIGYVSEPHPHSISDYHYWKNHWFRPEKYPEYWEEIKNPTLLTPLSMNDWVSTARKLAKACNVNPPKGEVTNCTCEVTVTYEYKR